MSRHTASRSEPGLIRNVSGPDLATLAHESRKLRNRLSQKAYRARQCMRIKELEQRLDSRPLSENSQVLELEQRNMFLRDELLTCHKKLESLQVTLRAISDSTANAVGLETGANIRSSRKNSDTSDRRTFDEPRNLMLGRDDEDSEESMETMEAENRHTEQLEKQVADKDITRMDLMIPHGTTGVLPSSQTDDQQLTLLATNPDLFDIGQLINTSLLQSDGTPSDDNHTFISPLSQVRLDVNFKHMGPAAYADLSETGPLLVQGTHEQLRSTNSLFSDHLTVVEYFLRQKWTNVGALMNRGDECLAQSVSFMLSAFVCMSWQMMTAWHTYTRAHVPVAKLMVWHLNPTTESFLNISTNYRPTQIQLSVPHPSIIDWVPWPTLRDKLIIYHSANPCLDDLICEIGSSYVAEGDLSKLIANVRPVMGYVGVWDLIQALAPEGTTNINGPTRKEVWSGVFDTDFSPGFLDDSDGGIDTAPQLPAPNVNALFSSKTLALQAFKNLGMNQGAVTFRLDPVFFERHPELYDCKASLLARGIPLRPLVRTSVPSPRTLDTSLLGRYRELTMWTFDLAFD